MGDGAFARLFLEDEEEVRKFRIMIPNKEHLQLF